MPNGNDDPLSWLNVLVMMVPTYIFLIYFCRQFLPVYMHVRVLVAAYLFQTGYGHFSYFWIKGDFGIHRVCQVGMNSITFFFFHFNMLLCLNVEKI